MYIFAVDSRSFVSRGDIDERQIVSFQEREVAWREVKESERGCLERKRGVVQSESERERERKREKRKGGGGGGGGGE